MILLDSLCFTNHVKKSTNFCAPLGMITDITSGLKLGNVLIYQFPYVSLLLASEQALYWVIGRKRERGLPRTV